MASLWSSSRPPRPVASGLGVLFVPTVSPGSTAADVLVLPLLGALPGKYAKSNTSSEIAAAPRTTNMPASGSADA